MEKCFTTQLGRLRGLETDGILQFHGIPYAKPPVDILRFAPPEPAPPWEGEYDATYRRPIAPQGPSDLDIPMGSTLGERSEDCLTLTVSTPSMKEKLPVAVWFHGGANCYGGGDLVWYDGASLARNQHIVVVGLNYRLGPFGFLCHPKVNDKTLCMEDQMLALHWIHDNIDAFGGDPNRVTLFGQSAGGNSIAYLLCRPDSDGLFQQIILESASLGRGNHSLEDAFDIGTDFISKLGILSEDGKNIKELLQKKTTEEMLDADARISPEIRKSFQGMVVKPVMDEWHTPQQFVAAMAKEAIRRNIRIVTGMTKDELHAFVLDRDPKALKQLAENQRLRYDLPGQLFARAAADGGCDVWKYRFDWRAPDSIFDACHCLELPFLFGNLNAWNAPMLKGASMEEMTQLQVTMQAFWGAFFWMKEPDAALWPKYSSDRPLLKIFDNRENPIIPEPDYGQPSAAL